MYTSTYAKNENEEDIKDFIRKNGFGIVVSTVEGKLWATHIPLILSGNKLQGHVSRGNKQWRTLPQNEEVMVIFQGPHTYVSSSWYNHENVPTWNYMAVHVYGRAHVQSEEELIESLRQLTNKYEQDSVNPVSVDKMSEKFLQTELRGTIGFEIAIERMEANYKLSQNRDDKNHAQIISELEK
ncbi:MAG: FMN-binding negative transcriptional regulator, partial [Cyclobacteriaceae bacterium]|nr:FMN-binding negative transcriptional regulator [Cyclobacteriaceae bacterium]